MEKKTLEMVDRGKNGADACKHKVARTGAHQTIMGKNLNNLKMRKILILRYLYQISSNLRMTSSPAIKCNDMRERWCWKRLRKSGDRRCDDSNNINSLETRRLPIALWKYINIPSIEDVSIPASICCTTTQSANHKYQISKCLQKFLTNWFRSQYPYTGIKKPLRTFVTTDLLLVHFCR